MATTKLMLRERVKRMLGYPSTRITIADRQIDQEVAAAVNKILKVQTLELFGDGQRVPDGAAIAFYPNVPVLTDAHGISSAVLPVIPIMLPRGAGVFMVCPSGYRAMEYTPIQLGMYSALKRNRILSPLSRSAYSVAGGKVIIYADLTAVGVTSVDMELCIIDIASAGDNDVLPVPAEMEADAIAYVLQLLSGEKSVRADDKQQINQKN